MCKKSTSTGTGTVRAALSSDPRPWIQIRSCTYLCLSLPKNVCAPFHASTLVLKKPKKFETCEVHVGSLLETHLKSFHNGFKDTSRGCVFILVISLSLELQVNIGTVHRKDRHKKGLWYSINFFFGSKSIFVPYGGVCTYVQ